MLPDNTLATTSTFFPFLAGEVGGGPANLIDFKLGGAGIQDPSQGLQVKIWTMLKTGNDITLRATDVVSVTLFSFPNITQLSFTFDQNMNPFVAFVAAGVAKYWWFDPLAGTTVFADIPGASSPRCNLDDKRSGQTFLGSSDIILAYLKGTDLYYRQQRDRFNIERLLKANAGNELLAVGMNTALRLQFILS